jgi:hypothetical protein
MFKFVSELLGTDKKAKKSKQSAAARGFKVIKGSKARQSLHHDDAAIMSGGCRTMMQHHQSVH